MRLLDVRLVARLAHAGVDPVRSWISTFRCQEWIHRAAIIITSDFIGGRLLVLRVLLTEAREIADLVVCALLVLIKHGAGTTAAEK